MSAKSSDHHEPVHHDKTVIKKVVKQPIVWWKVALLPIWVYVGFQLAQMIVVAVIYLLKLGGAPLADISPVVFNSSAAAVLYGISLLIVIGVPWVLKKYRVSPELIGLNRLPYWQDIGKALIGVVVYFVISAVLMYIAMALFSDFNSTEAQDVGFNDLGTRLDFILAFVTLVVIGPVVEEVLFRGFLFGTLRKIIPVWGAILITSALFAFVHGQWNLAIDTFAMSVVACFLTLKSRSLWPAIILHMLKNGIAFYVLYILH